eukprot:TRINITY_DN17397_c0_g1_i1.p1 TRINITY_DN17397_c0_g1~~TRINITY_DN17397_c0_g1_i1.p1  ORF type:complete len:327 (-),score=67.09 TRINITY_DN17397_c0_g1_i1:450-1430(-)
MALALRPCVKFQTTLTGNPLPIHVRPDKLPLRSVRWRQPSADFQELAGVLLFSALPFVTVKAIANSSLGEELQRRMLEQKGEIQRRASDARAAQEAARTASPWYGLQRPKWLGPVSYAYPPHLTGEAPGDYGYDPLELAKEPAAFSQYFNYEILHGRWAMLGALGALVPELLQRFGAVDFAEAVWWKVGYAKLQGDTLDYLGVPGLYIAGGQGVLIIAIAQVFLMFGPEYARYTGIEALEPLGICLPGDINYPGGALFDPLGLSKEAAAFEDLKVKEVKNARLAMTAWLGFAVQAVVTGKGPIENLFDFLDNPAEENVLAYIANAL